MNQLCEIIESSKEHSRETHADLLTMKCIHPEHGEIALVQGGSDGAIMIQPIN